MKPIETWHCLEWPFSITENFWSYLNVTSTHHMTQYMMPLNWPKFRTGYELYHVDQVHVEVNYSMLNLVLTHDSHLDG